jgi:hypothetical protein
MSRGSRRWLPAGLALAAGVDTPCGGGPTFFSPYRHDHVAPGADETVGVGPARIVAT